MKMFLQRKMVMVMAIQKAKQALNRERGVALLTILIMVVLATILAMTILKSQQANLDETKLLLRQNQSLMYAQSAEYFFSELLIQDAKDNQIDHLSENWAQPFPMFPVEDGFVSGQIIDQQSKFNLNSLLKEDGSRNEPAIAFFQAILLRLNFDPNLVEAVIDWQDADEETVGAMGAENSYYQGLKDGYLASNLPFTSVQQLQFVRGFKGDPYRLLQPYLTALPSRTTSMNLNTVDPFLLSCLSPQLDYINIANTLVQRRNNLEFFNSIEELWELDSFSRIETAERDKFNTLFGASSAYFTAEISVQLSERQRHLTVWLKRQNQSVESYQRSWLLQSQNF